MSTATLDPPTGMPTGSPGPTGPALASQILPGGAKPFDPGALGIPGMVEAAVEDGNPMGKKAVCLSLKLGKPGIRRKVNSESVSTDADKAQIEVFKYLLESPELTKVGRLYTDIRQFVTKRCLPTKYLHPGLYLLPVGLIQKVDVQLEVFRQELEGLVEAFITAYPQRIEEQRERLGSLFDESDYPTAEQMRDAFKMSVRYVNFGTPGTLKEVSADLFKRESEKAEKQWAEAVTEVRDALRVAMAEFVQHLVERLTNPEAHDGGKKKTFKATTVTLFQEFLDTFEHRNITEDGELHELVLQAKGLLAGVEPDALRKSGLLQATVRNGFQDIQDRLDQMEVVTKVRKISFDDDEE